MNDLDLQILKEALETLQENQGDYTLEAEQALQKVIDANS